MLCHVNYFPQKVEETAAAGGVVEQESWTMVPEKESSPPGREWMSPVYVSPPALPANDPHTTLAHRRSRHPPHSSERSIASSYHSTRSSASSNLSHSGSGSSGMDKYHSCTSLLDAAPQYQSEALEPLERTSDREEQQQQTPSTRSAASAAGVATDVQMQRTQSLAQPRPPALERSSSDEDEFHDLPPHKSVKSPME